MGLGDYLVGVVMLALVAGPLALGAWRVRRVLLPGWSGAPARVAEAVLALAALILVAELLGTVGLLERAPLAIACVAVGAGAVAWTRRRAEADGASGPVAARGAGTTSEPASSPAGRSPAEAAPPEGAEPPEHAGPPHEPSGRLATGIALAAVAAVAVAWLDRTDFSVHAGMVDPDTLWYHLPVAARFAQEGSITALHFTSYEPLTPFHPSNGSLVHAVGMVVFGNDFLSPLVNLGWLALALVSAWCIGRPFGAAPATLLGGAIAVGSPIVTGMDAGSAKDDVVGLALLLAAVALLVNGRGARAPGVLAAIAAGLLLGVKLSMVVPALLLAVVAVVAAPRARRAATAGTWLAAFVVVGGYWYARNLARTGNPAPWVDLGPLGLNQPLLAPYTERYVTGSLGDHFDEWGFWGDWFVPAAESALGPAWWAILLLAVGGGVAALVAGGGRLHRALGAAAVATVIAYAITPGSAGGSPDGVPHLVLWNMRHLTPGLALGLVCIPLIPALLGRRRWIPLAALALVFAVTQLASGVFELWGARPTAVALIGGLGAVALVALAPMLRRPLRRPVFAGAAAAIALTVGAAAGYKAQDIYFDGRYTDRASALGLPYVWARGVEDARIGIVGFFLQHPLYGQDLSNHVQYVGIDGGSGEFRSVANCAEWRRELAEGDYDYVVTAPFNYPWGASSAYPREARWTETDPAATRIGRDGPVAIFRLTGDPDPTTCARDGFPARERQEQRETGTRPPTS